MAFARAGFPSFNMAIPVWLKERTRLQAVIRTGLGGRAGDLQDGSDRGDLIVVTDQCRKDAIDDGRGCSLADAIPMDIISPPQQPPRLLPLAS